MKNDNLNFHNKILAVLGALIISYLGRIMESSFLLVNFSKWQRRGIALSLSLVFGFLFFIVFRYVSKKFFIKSSNGR